MTTVYNIPHDAHNDAHNDAHKDASGFPFKKIGTVLHPDGLLKAITPISFVILTPPTSLTPQIHVYDIRCRSAGGFNGVRQFPSNRIIDLSRQETGRKDKWNIVGVDSKGTIYDVDCKSCRVTYSGTCPISPNDTALRIKQVEGFTCVLTSKGVCYRCEPSLGSKVTYSKWTTISSQVLTILTVPTKSYILTVLQSSCVVYDSWGHVVEKISVPNFVDVCVKSTMKGCRVLGCDNVGRVWFFDVPKEEKGGNVNVQEYGKVLRPDFKGGTPGFGSVQLKDPTEGLGDIEFQLDSSMHSRPLPPSTSTAVPTSITTPLPQPASPVPATSFVSPLPPPLSAEISKRTPCPRLCGAHFHLGLNGSGPDKGYGMEVGGLVRFNNGGIRKVWKWYQEVKENEDVVGEEFDDGLNDIDVDNDIDSSIEPSNDSSNPSSSSPSSSKKFSTPRTFNDLTSCLEKYHSMEWEGKVGPADSDDEDDASSSSSSSSSSDSGIYASYFKTPPNPRSTSVTSDARKSAVDVNLQDSVKVTVEIVSQYDPVISGGMKGDIAEELDLPSLTLKPSQSTVTRICSNNARVYRSFNFEEKAAVWDLLSILLTPGPTSDVSDVDVYGDIVSRIMEYYKEEGDVQILSTVMCLLRSVEMEPKEKFKGEHDRLLRTYAEILGSWGKVKKRTEICKRITPLPNADAAMGLDIGFLCPRCGGVANDKNVCATCRDFAFRCGVCNERVRGAAISCFGCGHGGCAEHYREWFSEGNEECPVGCGCKCKDACWVSGGGDGAGAEVMKKVESALSFGSINSWTANEAHGAGLGSGAMGRLSGEVDPKASSLVMLGAIFSGSSEDGNAPGDEDDNSSADALSIGMSMATADGKIEEKETSDQPKLPPARLMRTGKKGFGLF
ncbi:hypothetical protein TrST_g11095 [Triparma strigata]|uniref:WDR59/RTC1-like RING zinc finger domain-containing protein n=1 Tax=Triparma strigata TaxID=1606541 RepID=A0A9W7AF50_9STRA|nr:hypothetical protein TrST_g11095 [Triparma strigata]